MVLKNGSRFSFSFGYLGKERISCPYTLKDYFSVYDIVSDYILFFHYSGEKTVTKILSPLDNNTHLNGTSIASCKLMNETDEGFEFHCEEHNPYFASLTVTFIYLPSLNVVAAVYGSRIAGQLGKSFGIVMLIFGVILMNTFDESESQAMFEAGMTVLFLGFGILVLYFWFIDLGF